MSNDGKGFIGRAVDTILFWPGTPQVSRRKRIIVVVLFICAVVLSGYVSVQLLKIRKAMRGGEFALNHQFPQAIESFTLALEMTPDAKEQTKIYYMRAASFFANKQYRECIADADKVIENDPSNAKAYVMRGYSYAAISDPANALQSYSQALALNPQYYDALAARCQLYYEAGDYQNSLQDLTAAIAIKPVEVPELYKIRSDVYRLLGDTEKAAADTETYNSLKSRQS